MKKRLLYLVLPIITLILEILPYGAVCIFATSPTETIRETFSYLFFCSWSNHTFVSRRTSFVAIYHKKTIDQ